MAAPKRLIILNNPTTHEAHRKESSGRSPCTLLIGLADGGGNHQSHFFAATQPVSELRRWADVSVIWLILPALLFTLIGMLILAGLVYAVSAILKILRVFRNCPAVHSRQPGRR
jgi:hypothetical protein